MKRPAKNVAKLVLRRETLCALTGTELACVVGGLPVRIAEGQEETNACPRAQFLADLIQQSG